MTSRAALFAGLFASVMATASCGTSPNSIPATPAGPSSISDLLLPRLGGLWGGDLRFNGVSGGGTAIARDAGLVACAGAAFDAVTGEVNGHSLSITQSGTDVTAKLVSSTTGLACTYEGRVGSDNNLALHAGSCQPSTFTLLCPNPNGRPFEVDMALAGSSITATFDAPVNVTTIRGTAAHTYVVPGEGSLVVNQSFTNFTRR
jgi:hypothetical protein